MEPHSLPNFLCRLKLKWKDSQTSSWNFCAMVRAKPKLWTDFGIWTPMKKLLLYISMILTWSTLSWWISHWREINFIYQINTTSLPLIWKITLNALHINHSDVGNEYGSNSNFVFLCQLMGTDYNQPVTDNAILNLFYSKITSDVLAIKTFHLEDWVKSIFERTDNPWCDT